MTMKLSGALLATLPRRELEAVLNTGSVSKADQRAISALRAGDPGDGQVAKQRIFATIRKQFADKHRKTEMLAEGIYQYAKQRFTEQEKPMTDVLLEERVNKARDTQAMLHDAVRKYQAAHPGCNRADAIDKILFSPTVREMVDLDHRMDELAKLGGGSLPTPGPGRMHRTHNDAAPVRGRTGYDSSVDGRPPHNPDAGEEPTIHDQHEILEGIKSGKIPFNDPRASAQVALERKNIFKRS
jgi:hypothetical protein